MADWPNEGSDDLLSWSPLYSHSDQPSGSHESFSNEDSGSNQPTGDHSVTALPEHQSNLGDYNDNTGDHLAWPAPSAAPDSPNFPLNITDTREHAGSSISQYNLLPSHETPMTLFGMAASHSDNRFQLLPDPASNSIDQKIGGGFRRARRDHAEYIRNASIHPSKPMIPSSPSLSMSAGTQSHVLLPPHLVEQVKADAQVNMMGLIFETTFFPVDAVLTRMANDALSIAVARQHNAELNQWKERTEGLEEVQRLKGTVTTVLNDLKMVARFSVILAYGLSLIISERGSARTAHRVHTIQSLLLNDSFLDGLIDLRGSDGRIQQFVVPFAHPAIIRLIEIILLELQYHRFVFFDNSDKWKTRLTNVFAVGGTLCKWLFNQYSTGFFVAAELVTEDNASYYDSLIYIIGRLDPDKRRFFDGLLVDIHDLLTA